MYHLDDALSPHLGKVLSLLQLLYYSKVQSVVLIYICMFNHFYFMFILFCVYQIFLECKNSLFKTRIPKEKKVFLRENIDNCIIYWKNLIVVHRCQNDVFLIFTFSKPLFLLIGYTTESAFL